jgi:hypothetical protein
MFIMKNFHFVLLISLFAFDANAQYNLSFKTGLAWGNIDVVADARAVDLNSYRDEPNYQFALSCTKHLTKEFCIGAETGLNSFAHFFIYQVPDPVGNLENYNGRYEINQAYLAFVPEYQAVSLVVSEWRTGRFRRRSKQVYTGICPKRTAGATTARHGVPQRQSAGRVPWFRIESAYVPQHVACAGGTSGGLSGNTETGVHHSHRVWRRTDQSGITFHD